MRVEVPCGSQLDLEDQAGTGLRWENGEEEDELSQGPECWGDDKGDEAQVQPHRRKKRSSYSSIRLREQEAWEQLLVPLTQCFNGVVMIKVVILFCRSTSRNFCGVLWMQVSS